MDSEIKEQETQTGANTAEAEKLSVQKLTRKEKRRLWKEEKKAAHLAQKEHYRYAPFVTRVWNVYLKKPFLVIAILAALCFLFLRFVWPDILEACAIMSYYETDEDRELTEEEIAQMYEMAPVDEEGEKKIDSYPQNGKDETWTICVYMVGSNLEDCGENDLSGLVNTMIQDKSDEISSQNYYNRMDNLSRFTDELEENGLDFPAYFFYPEHPVASSEAVVDEVVVSDVEGAGSRDISEMTSDVWSDNIRIVIQPVGATHWSNSMINPNRTQRFLYRKGLLEKVDDKALEPASEPDSLADFLRFCKNKYPADHTMLVLWNHGSGPFGYGSDSLYGGSFSLKDIREALSAVYAPDIDNPPFDIIGFDACLMSCLDVTHALDGFAKFYCLSEESEPGDGWDYGPFLTAMTEDPTMSSAKVAQSIVDANTNYYMQDNIRNPLFNNDVTFSVIDASKASELYDAYGELCRAQLLDACDDMGVLAEIGKCAGKSTRYGGSYSKVFNLVDLGNYTDYLVDSYPDECSRIKELIDEAVLYHRENGALIDSTGIAVYVPNDIEDHGGLLSFLDYVYNISDNSDINALYYYKQAGCLSEDLMEQSSLADAGKLPQVLNVKEFKKFVKIKPEFDDNGFVIPIGEKLQSLMTGYEMQIGLYDEEFDMITYLGRDDSLYVDGEGNLVSDFEGEWIYLNDAPLHLEVVSSKPATTVYRSHVYYNEDEAYLGISCDHDTGEVFITDVRKVPDESEEDINYLTNTRSRERVEPGANITPIYDVSYFDNNSTGYITGDTVTLDENTELKWDTLDEGYYVATARITDPRGDSYYSAVIGITMDRSGIRDQKIDKRFYGSEYN